MDFFNKCVLPPRPGQDSLYIHPLSYSFSAHLSSSPNFDSPDNVLVKVYICSFWEASPMPQKMAVCTGQLSRTTFCPLTKLLSCHFHRIWHLLFHLLLLSQKPSLSLMHLFNPTFLQLCYTSSWKWSTESCGEAVPVKKLIFQHARILLRIRGGGILTRLLASPSPPPSPGFITPAGLAQASGHASSIAIPT